jgi:5-(carboxyamino)imidazole ribonucleotide mutase
MASEKPLVAVLMGSASDAPLLEPCLKTLKSHSVPFVVRILSAHRTPQETAAFVTEAEREGVEVFIAAAGMAAHLAGAVAARTVRPVIGIPLASGPLNGQDALLSTVMMPPGLPVATVAVNGAQNAAVLAVQILALSRFALGEALREGRERMRREVLEKDRALPRE